MKKASLWILALVCAVLLSACGKSNLVQPVAVDEDGNEISSSEEGYVMSEESKEETESIEEAETTPSFYLILPTAAGGSSRMESIIRKSADEEEIEVTVKYYDHDPELLTQYFDEAIEAGAELIVCDNCDNEKTTEACQKAKDGGIPVFLLNKGIDTLGIAKAQIITDTYSCVSELGERFLEHTAEHSKYVSILGSKGAFDVIDAFSIAMSGHKGMELIASDVADENDELKSYDAIWEMLNSEPDADALVCYNAMQAMCGVDAAGDLGRELTIICLMGDADEIETMIDEEKIYAAAVKPAEDIAKTVCPMIKDYLKRGVLPDDEVVFVKGEVITGELPPREWLPEYDEEQSSDGEVTEGEFPEEEVEVPEDFEAPAPQAVFGEEGLEDPEMEEYFEQNFGGGQ